MRDSLNNYQTVGNYLNEYEKKTQDFFLIFHVELNIVPDSLYL